ncbi:CPBP family intramembrane metalloprotease [Chryseobacterium gallinarum]|uniref:CPBP family intramembrane glutamic endopeptidase n=1 Tax=Chryseobacterium gallinarum TaxID=1324352 RepID=UPI002023F66B|nr:type II CAAX endopeptidase family protein [Chryseobacterium gallinarum]MCL8538328.1 CPBP family intramembrane metalloprotease [Chryseobacterium gallinarum]
MAIGLHGKYSIGVLLTFILLAAAMLYVFPVISMITGVKGITAFSFSLSRIVLWAILLMLFLYSHFVEKGSFLLKGEKKYSLAFRVKAIISLYLICAIGGAFLNVVLQLLVQEKMSEKLFDLTSIFRHNYFLIIFTCFTAGAVEEFLMRGYVQPRIEKIYNSPVLGIFISALLFGLLHSTYGTISQVIIPFFIGVVFAVFYKKYSNITILISCHFMIDFVSLMIMNSFDSKHLSVF